MHTARPGWLELPVIVLLSVLVCLAPLLHAHPANGTDPNHPAGIHLPDQTVAPAFLGTQERQSAPVLAAETRALATIVVAESFRRDVSPTPPGAEGSDAHPPLGARGAIATSPRRGPTAPGAVPPGPDWPPPLARPPPSSV